MIGSKLHLELANNHWKKHLTRGSNAVDATCGNGHDSLALAKIIEDGRLFCYDIQEKAIENTKERLLALPYQNITFFQKSHCHFDDIPADLPIHLIVYNLGYLPLGNKTITTQTETTLQSIASALERMAPGGAISIVAYPGHDEGEKEEKALLAYFASLPSSKFTICYHNWVNRPKSPTFFWITKI